MFGHVLLLLLQAYCSKCFLKERMDFMNGQNYFKQSAKIYDSLNVNDTTCNVTNYGQFYYVKSSRGIFNHACENCDTGQNVIKPICASEMVANDVYFPKCCPPNYEYESKDHRCAQKNSSAFLDEIEIEMLVKSGLENCKLIVDYAIENSSVIKIRQDRSLYFQNRVYSYGNYCLDNDYYSENLIVRICHDIDVCKRHDSDHMRCIKKCCPDGQIYKGKTCAPAMEFGLNVKSHTDRIKNADEKFAVLVSEKCSRYPAFKDKYQYYIETNGSIFVNESGLFKEHPIDDTYYCMEYIDMIGFGYMFMFCTQNAEPLHVKFQFTRIILLVSCVCLLITILGYVLLPELDNLIGKIIICYCSSLLVAFIGLSWIQFDVTALGLCKPIGFLVAFSFLAAFNWMNVMSFIIWCVLGSMKTQKVNQRHKDRRKFMWCSIYGWSMPILITSVAIIDHQYWILPEHLRPHVGNLKCMIEKQKENNYGFYLYFVAPCGLFIISNMIVFVKTIYYFLKVKSDIDRMNDTDSLDNKKKRTIFHADKERIVMVLRIFIVMGGNWLFETISSIVDFKQNSTLEIIELVLDLFNASQGVFIFCIFMMKRKVLQAIAKKIGLSKQRKISVTTLTVQNSLNSCKSSLIKTANR